MEQKQLQEVDMEIEELETHLEELSCTGLGTNLMNTDLVFTSC